MQTANNSPGIANCYAYQWFWLSWTGGVMTMGQGTLVGLNVVSVFNDQSSFQSYFYFGTTLWSGDAGIEYMAVGSLNPSSWIIPGCYYNPG